MGGLLSHTTGSSEISETSCSQNQVRFWGHITRDLYEVFRKYDDGKDRIPIGQLRKAFNDVNLFPSRSQIFEMVQCAVEYGSPCEPDHVTFGEFCILVNELNSHYQNCQGITSPKPKSLYKEKRQETDSIKWKKRVFLGGSCNPTTWRHDIAIPFFKEHGITFYNPQVQNWRPELVELEAQAKESADILFFVIVKETRAISSLIEVGYLVASQKQVIVVLTERCNKIKCDFTSQEMEDLCRGKRILEDLVERNSVPVFTDIHVALKCTEICLTQGLRVQDLTLQHGAQPVLHGHIPVGETLLQMREAFNSMNSAGTAIDEQKLTPQELKLAYKSCTGKDLEHKWLKKKDKNGHYCFEEFCGIMVESQIQHTGIHRKIAGFLTAVISSICRKCRETVYRIEEQWTSCTESSQAPVFQDPQFDDNIKQQPAQELDTDSKVTVSTPMGSCSEDCDRSTKKYEDTLPKNTQETVSIQMACSSEGFDRTCRLRKIVQTLPSNTLAEEMSGSSSQELTESSQELTSSQGSNWSTNEGINALTRYNHAVSQLSKGNLSPLKYQLRSAITDVTPQGKNYIKRKALQVVNTALEIIAPGQAEELMNLLLPQKSQVSSKDNEFMVLDFLKKLYNDSTSKTVKEQLVSVMANLTTKEKVMDMLSITKYKVEKVRALSLDAIKEKNEEPPKKRQRMDEGKLDHALSFFFDPAFHQLVSYGTREMKLENGEAIIIPDVVRTSCHSTMVNMYQTYCEEEHYDPLSRSTLYKILRACSAAKRKNLHGLDNITADGMQAFSDLEKIITSIYERGDTSHEIQKSIQSGLNKGKNYLKCQFKFHVSLESNCADHCIHWALSDPKEKCFQEECTHEHDTECMHCNLIDDTLSQIERLPLTDDEVNDVSMAKLNISNWKGHILKTVNQDRSRIDHIDGLQPNQMFIVMDWAMKHLPQFHRETSSDWFGQKGVSWHVAVCMYKTGTEVNHQTMVHILESGKQDWYSVASILEHLLSTIKQQRPQVDEVFCRSDNAGCYHCGQLWSSLHAIGQRTGLTGHDDSMSISYSEKEYRDVYLGGSCGDSNWRDKTAIPLLRKNGISYINPHITGYNQRLIPIQVAAREKCRILLYVITNRTRSLSSMIEAGYYVGLGCKVVLCIQQITEGAVISGEKITKCGWKDYTRGRTYLTDLANREGVHIFENVEEAVSYCVRYLQEHTVETVHKTVHTS